MHVFKVVVERDMEVGDVVDRCTKIRKTDSRVGVLTCTRRKPADGCSRAWVVEVVAPSKDAAANLAVNFAAQH